MPSVSTSAIPPKVEEAFRLFRYVPYNTLLVVARVKVACSEEDVILNANGGFSLKSLDHHNEKSISVVDWLVAAHAAEERTHFHNGKAQADALAMHHKVVMDLGHTHSWEIAVEYDIQQHELSSLNPTHNLSSIDIAALTVIATHAPIHRHPPHHLSNKVPNPH